MRRLSEHGAGITQLSIAASLLPILFRQSHRDLLGKWRFASVEGAANRFRGLRAIECEVCGEALRLAAAFKTEAELWVNMQAQYGLWTVSRKARPKVKALVTKRAA